MDPETSLDRWRAVPPFLDAARASVAEARSDCILICQRFQQCVPTVLVKFDIELRRHIIGQFEQLAPTRDRQQQRFGAFFDGQFGQGHSVVDRFDGTTQGHFTDHDQPPAYRLFQQRAGQCDQRRDTSLRTGFGSIKAPELDRKFVAARVTISDQLLRAGIEVLLGAAD